MELAQITAGQVVMLFLLMGTGIAAVKTGVLKPEGKQTLSNLLVYLVVPAMIVNSYRMEFNMEILHNLLAAFGMSPAGPASSVPASRWPSSARRQGQPYPHLPVRLHFFQCGVHGFSAHLGAVRVRGSALCQRLCDRVQHSAVDHGLRLCEREFRPQRGPAQPAAHTGSVRHGDRPLHLPAADPGAAAHRPAAGADGQHDHTPFHGHHRHAPCRRGPGLHRAQQAGVEAGRRAHAADPRPSAWRCSGCWASAA